MSLTFRVLSSHTTRYLTQGTPPNKSTVDYSLCGLSSLNAYYYYAPLLHEFGNPHKPRVPE